LKPEGHAAGKKWHGAWKGNLIQDGLLAFFYIGFACFMISLLFSAMSKLFHGCGVLWPMVC